jgi:SAM-dependent methyltransferase
MKPALLDVLRCPACPGASTGLALAAAERRGDDVVAGRLACAAGHAFPIDDGIPDFVAPHETLAARSAVYDTLWAGHAVQRYAGRLGEYREKFQAFARLPEPLEAWFAGKVVLDAGCGEGRFTYLAAALGAAHVVAVDYSREALGRARTGTGDPPNCSFVRADVLALPLARAFDTALSLGVLHHTEDTARAFRSVVACVRPGGVVTIFVYGRWTLPGIIWPLRRLTLGMDRARVARLCDDWGFGYDPARRPRAPLGRIFRRLGRLDVLGIGRVTYEGLTTPYLHEHSLAEVRRWFAEADLELLSSTRMVSASGRRR